MERKQVQIFEQAMCCPTGLCGPSIDPELLRISAVLDTLEKHGILVERYNLSNAPLKFIQTPAAAEFLQHAPDPGRWKALDGRPLSHQ